MPWRCGGTTRPAAPLSILKAFEHPYLQRSRQYFDAHQREMWVLDLTADLGIPGRGRRYRGR
jgi:hypothetical protein